MTGRSGPLNLVGPQELVQVHPADAKKLGIRDGDWVKLSTRRGAIALKADVTDRVPEKTLFMAFHYWQAAGNELTNAEFDPVTSTPEYNVAAVKVEKITPQEAQKMIAEKREKYRVQVEKEMFGPSSKAVQQGRI